MTSPSRPILYPSLLGGSVLLMSAAVSPMAPSRARAVLPGLMALGVGMVLFGRTGAAARRALADATARAVAAEARSETLARAAAQMRHDLRGILSPALLTADRLAMSQDPASRRAGEAMITTVERAEQRLRGD